MTIMEYLIKVINESEMNEDTICELIGMDKKTLKRKLNAEIEFTVNEVIKLTEILSLSAKEIELIFLTDHSQKMRKEGCKGK